MVQNVSTKVTSTGSFMNLLMAHAAPTIPEVGMGATSLHWTDRHACTIVAISTSLKRGLPTWVDAQRDTATRKDSNGMSECQDYEYAANPNASIQRYTLRKNDRYVRMGDSIRGQSLLVGSRREYHDFSF